MFLYRQKYNGPTVHVGMFDKRTLSGEPFIWPGMLDDRLLSEIVRDGSVGFLEGDTTGNAVLASYELDKCMEETVRALCQNVAKFMCEHEAMWMQIDDFDCLEAKSRAASWYLVSDDCVYYVAYKTEVDVRLLRHMILLGLLGRHYACPWTRRSVGIFRTTDRWLDSRSAQWTIRQGSVLSLPLANVPESVIDGMQSWIDSVSGRKFSLLVK